MGIVGKIRNSTFYKAANLNCTQLLYGRPRTLIKTDKFRSNSAVKTANCRAPKTQFMHRNSLQTFGKYEIAILYWFDIAHLLKWQHLCPLLQRLCHCCNYRVFQHGGYLFIFSLPKVVPKVRLFTTRWALDGRLYRIWIGICEIKRRSHAMWLLRVSERATITSRELITAGCKWVTDYKVQYCFDRDPDQQGVDYSAHALDIEIQHGRSTQR